MEKRIGTLSVFIEDKKSIDNVNEILSKHNEIIISRMGVPYRERGVAVIVLIIDATTDQLGALSGSLGNLKGVSVKSAVSKIK